MSKRLLSVFLCLAVMLVALPIVPFTFGTIANAEETTVAVYDNGPDFRIVASKDANSFPSTSGGYLNAATAPGAGSNLKYYAYKSSSSITYEYDTEKEAVKFTNGTAAAVSSSIGAYVKNRPTAGTNMVSFHLDATNVAGSSGAFNAIIRLTWRQSSKETHTAAPGHYIYFQPDGTDDIEKIFIPKATSSSKAYVPLKAGMSGTYYIPGVCFEPTTTDVSGYTDAYSNSRWKKLNDASLTSSSTTPSWHFDGSNYANNILYFASTSLGAGESVYMDDVRFLEVVNDPKPAVYNESFKVIKEYDANTFPHSGTQLNSSYSYDPGARKNPARYGAGDTNFTFTFDSETGRGVYTATANDSSVAADIFIKRLSTSGVNMLSLYGDFTNVGTAGSAFNVRLGVSYHSEMHLAVGGSKFYFIPDATEENPNPTVEEYIIPTASSVWNVYVPFRAGRAGTYYFPDKVFGDHVPENCGYTDAESKYSHSDKWSNFESNFVTTSDNNWFFDGNNYSAASLHFSMMSVKEGESFILDDLKYVEYVETGDLFAAPEAGTVPTTDILKGISTDALFEEKINTVETWVKTSATQSGYIVGNMYHKNNAHAEEFAISMNDAGNPVLFVSDGDLNKYTWTVDTVTINDGTWKHIAFVKDDSTKTIYFYLNSFLKGTYTYETLNDIVPNQTLVIGHTASEILTTTGFFKGEIADIRVWSDARTADEIAQGIIDFAEVDNTGLIARWMLDPADPYTDETGNYPLEMYNFQIGADNELFAEFDKEMTDAVADGGYSLIFIPDTQKFNVARYEYFDNPFNWMIDYKDRYNIKGVFGLGDVTDKCLPEEWERADVQYNRLTGAGIPWMSIIGNHDYDGCSIAPHKTTYFDSIFNLDNIPTMTMEKDGVEYRFGGMYKDSLINSYFYLTVGETEYIMLFLECEPPRFVAQWADTVLAKNSDKRAIVLTHQYMNAAGQINSDAYYDQGLSGKALWEDHLANHNNIDMVICGHSTAATIRYCPRTNAYGRVVPQFLMDTQGLDSSDPPASAIGIATFSADGSKVSFKYYSTSLYETDEEGNVTSYGYYLDEKSCDLKFELGANTAPFNDKSMDMNEVNLNAADFKIGANVWEFDKVISTAKNSWLNETYYAYYNGTSYTNTGYENNLSGYVSKVTWDNNRAAAKITAGGTTYFYLRKLPNFTPINGEKVKGIAFNYDASESTVATTLRINLGIPYVSGSTLEGRNAKNNITEKTKYILVWEDGTVQTKLVGTQRLTLPVGFKGQIILPLDNVFTSWATSSGADILFTSDDFYTETEGNTVRLSLDLGCSADATVYLDNITYVTDFGKNHHVTVKDIDGKILKVFEIEDGMTIAEAGITMPTASARHGYTFTGWTNEDIGIFSDMVITPLYEKDTTTEYEVATNPESEVEIEVKLPAEQEKAYYNDRVTLTAPATNEAGQKFAYWNINGSKFSYSSTISFLVFDELDITPIYADEVEENPVVIYTNANDNFVMNGNKWNLQVMGVVDAGENEVTEIGILLSASEMTAEEMKAGFDANDGTVVKMAANAAVNGRQFLYTVKNIATNRTRCATVYAIVNGELVVGDAVTCVTVE